MGRTNAERLQLLTYFVPELISEPGTILYIGAYNRRFFASKPLFLAGNEVTILEVWEPFIDGLKKSRWSNRYKHIIKGDVTKLEKVTLPHEKYDYTLWFHGPEHIEKEYFLKSVKDLHALTKKTIVISCPWGEFVHGVAYDNPHTEHKSHYFPSDFAKLGYRMVCLGQPNRKGSQLQAWKRFKKD